MIIILLIPILFFLPNYRATIERAKKIDPTVKILTDASFVLSKEIVKKVLVMMIKKNSLIRDRICF